LDPNSNLQEGNPGWRDERACEPHAQSATAFHFLISKRLLGLREEDEDGPAAEDPSPAGAGGGGALMSVSMADIALGLGSLRFDWGQRSWRWRVFVWFAQFLSEARGFMEKENEVPSVCEYDSSMSSSPCCASQQPLDRNFGRLVLLRLSLPAAMKTINENDRKTGTVGSNTIRKPKRSGLFIKLLKSNMV